MNIRFRVCTLILLLLCGSVAQAAVFCATSGNELNGALETAGNNDADDIVKVATGVHTTDYRAPGGYQWEYPTYYSAVGYEESIEISGGWNAADNCQTQITKDPSFTVLDARYWGPAFRIIAAIDGVAFTGTVKISNLTFTRGEANSSFNVAGLAVLLNGGNITIDNVLVRDNRSGEADTVVSFFQMFGPGITKIRNSQFINNSLTGPNSAGVYFWMNGGAVGQFTNNSISGNSVTAANKGLDSLGVATLTNNAVGGNVSTAPDNWEFVSGAPTELTLVNNHFESVAFFNGAPFSEVNTTTGNPAWTQVGYRMVPDAVSPLRDSGNNTPLGQLPNIDFSGNPRIVNVTIDRGAVEADAPPSSEVGPLITAVSPADGSTTVFEGPIGGGFVGTQLTFDVSGGVAPGVTELECSVTSGAPAFGIGSIGETVGVGGSITPIDVGFDNITSEVQTATVTCAVIRELAGTSYLTFNFVAAPPGGPAVIATSPLPSPDPSHVIDLTPAIAAVAGSDVLPKPLKVFNVADFGSSDLLLECFPSGGSDPQILITPSNINSELISPQGAVEVSFDCDTTVPGSYAADFSCYYDLDDTTNPESIDGEALFRAECDVRPPPKGPVYGSNPSAADDIDFGSVIQNNPDPFVDLQITNYGAAESTLSGTCSITAGGGTFSISGDNAFSLGQNLSDTVRVVCDSAQALQQHTGELQCEHNGEAPGDDSPAVYQLDCDIVPPPASDVIPTPPSGTSFEAVLDPGGTFGFDVQFPEVKNEGVDASLVSCSLDDGSVFAITSPASFPQVIGSGSSVTVSVSGTAPDGATTITDTLRCTYTDTDSDNVEVVYPINVIVSGKAQFAVTKDFSDDNPGDVTVRIDCFTGLPLEQEIAISEGDGNPAVVFVVDSFDGGELDCKVSEEPVPGYRTSYLSTGDSDSSNESDGCVFTDVAAGAENGCIVINSADPVEVVINKEWVIEGSARDTVDTSYQLILRCNAMIENGYPCESSSGVDSPAGPAGFDICRDFYGTESDTFIAKVGPEYPHSNCLVEEKVYASGVEIDNNCNDIVVSAGHGDECTITNTVFFEGIPTLNQYGMALLALLMMGVGLVGFRRFA